MNTVTTITETYLKPVASQPHENMHPAQINFADYDNNPALKSASETLGYGFTQGSEIRELRARRAGTILSGTRQGMTAQFVSGLLRLTMNGQCGWTTPALA